MILEELQMRYGVALAERVRQELTLKEFSDLEVEELVHYFELRAARAYEEYRRRLDEPLPLGSAASSQEEYLDILRRRWQKAEDTAHTVLAAELAFEQQEQTA